MRVQTYDVEKLEWKDEIAAGSIRVIVDGTPYTLHMAEGGLCVSVDWRLMVSPRAANMVVLHESERNHA